MIRGKDRDTRVYSYYRLHNVSTTGFPGWNGYSPKKHRIPFYSCKKLATTSFQPLLLFMQIPETDLIGDSSVQVTRNFPPKVFAMFGLESRVLPILGLKMSCKRRRFTDNPLCIVFHCNWNLPHNKLRAERSNAQHFTLLL